VSGPGSSAYFQAFRRNEYMRLHGLYLAIIAVLTVGGVPACLRPVILLTCMLYALLPEPLLVSS
jgi:hypothetical protein